MQEKSISAATAHSPCGLATLPIYQRAAHCSIYQIRFQLYVARHGDGSARRDQAAELDCTCEPCALKTTKVPPELKDHFVAELCNEYRRLYRLEKPGAGHRKLWTAAKVPYIVGSWDIFEFGEGLWVWMYRNRRFAHSYPRPHSARRNVSLSFRWHHNPGRTECDPSIGRSRQCERRCANDCAASAQDTGRAEISCGRHPVQPKTRRRVCPRWLAVLDDGIRWLLRLPQRQLS